MVKEIEFEKQNNKRLAVVCVLSFLVLLIMLGLVFWKGFRIQKVEVDGSDLYPAANIENWILNDKLSWNAMYVWAKYLVTDPEEIPFLEEPKITMKDPHTLHIQLKEKDIIGYLYVPAVGQNAYFNEDGIVVETSSERLENIMAITGITLEDVTPGEKIPIKQGQLKRMLNLTKALHKYQIMPQSVSYDDYSNIMLQYDSVTVNFGNSEYLTEKTSALSEIIPQLKGMTGILHMENWTEESTDIPFEKVDKSQ